MAQATAEKKTQPVDAPPKEVSRFNRSGIAGVSKGMMAGLERVP